MRNYLLATFLFLISYSGLYAQDKTVTGSVRDSESEIGIAGVTITVVGKDNSTQTNEGGAFTIQAGVGDELQFEFVGYETQVVTVGEQSVINVSMEGGGESLDEVVVVGYGTQKKVDVTGAISTLNSEEITKQPAMSAMQSVQGKMAGVNIVASEAPGAAPNVIIRGLGTALGGRDPLYIVDGMPAANINNINPSDIESINVLKDASSASIYGLRAANGVVMVTTKRGREGTVSINFDSYAGVKNILNKVKMANGSEYISYVNENLSAIGEDWELSSSQPYETNWYDETIRLGSVFNNAINISGGSAIVDYFFSANNFTENGILDGQKFARNTIRNNNTYKFFDNKLKLHQNVNVTLTNANPKPFDAFNSAYRQSPLVPVMYNNGRYGRPFVNQTTGVVTYEAAGGETVGSLNSIGNPVYTIDRYNQVQNTAMIQANFEADYQITDWLKFNSRVGVNKYYYNNRSFTDIKDAWLNADPARTEAEFEQFRNDNPTSTNYAYNSLTVGQEETLRWVWENFLTFQKSYGNHNIEAILGMSRERVGIGTTFSGQGYDVPGKDQYWSIDLANSAGNSEYQKTVQQTYFTPTALASYFGRLQYNFASKYYLTATLRRDGSSVFKENSNYWSTFPSVGAGWTISNESFMQDAEWINFLKLRGNFGVLGNQNIPLNTSQINTSATSSDYNYVFGNSQALIFGAAFGTPALQLNWEKTYETGFGVDFAFLNNNLTGSLDYYHKLNSNAILDVTPTLNSQFENNFYAHGGKVLNQGVEAVVNWSKSVTEDFSYTIGVNYAYNKNEVKEVTSAYDGAIGGSLSNGQITKQLREGQPIYSWWMWETDGVWQNVDEIANGATTGTPIPGHLKYKDQNGDGEIDNRDKVFFGSYLPTSTYGVNLGASYKSFDFSLSGYGVAGNKIYNALKGTRIDGGENITQQTFSQRWTGEGSTNEHPGAARDSYASSYYLESGAYFRINNATLGYTINKLYSESSKLRIYFTAQNPLIFTKYSGFSPEIQTSDGSPSGTTGVELTAYPTTRNFLFGVNLQF